MNCILYIFKFGRLAFDKLLGEKFAEVIYLLAVEKRLFAQNQQVINGIND